MLQHARPLLNAKTGAREAEAGAAVAVAAEIARERAEEKHREHRGTTSEEEAALA